MVLVWFEAGFQAWMEVYKGGDGLGPEINLIHVGSHKIRYVIFGSRPGKSN